MVGAMRAAILAVGVAVLGMTCGPALAQTSERALVAYTLSAPNSSEIFVMRSDGSERRRLVSGEKDEERPEPLAAGSERLLPNGGDHARMRLDRAFEPRLQCVEICLESRCCAKLLQHRHVRVPV